MVPCYAGYCYSHAYVVLFGWMRRVEEVLVTDCFVLGWMERSGDGLVFVPIPFFVHTYGGECSAEALYIDVHMYFTIVWLV